MDGKRVLFVMLAFLFLLSGCGSSRQEPVSSGGTGYFLSTGETTQGTIHLRYPQITGLQDQKKQKTINEMIKTAIWESQVAPEIENYGDDQLTLELQYRVTLQSDRLLSVVYTGTGNMKEGMHAYDAVDSITIDLQTAGRLRVSDFAAIDEAFIQKIGESTEMTNQAVEDGMDPDSFVEVVQGIVSQAVDTPYASIIDELENGSAFYLTTDALVVSLQVVEAYGGYALITLPGSYYADWLKRPTA